MIKGFKIKIYPTKDQELMIWRHIGACRYIWNYMLDLQKERHESGDKHLSGYDMVKLLPGIKSTDRMKWLNDISSSSLQRSCMSLDNAYKSFFKNNSRYPRYKSRKRSIPKYPVCCDKFYFDEDSIQIQKLGRVRYKSDFRFPNGKSQKYCNVCISFVRGKYMLSFGMECENQAQRPLNGEMGIDLGIKELAVVSYDDKKIVFHNINKSKRVRTLKRMLKHASRSVSRKYEFGRKQTGAYHKTNNIIREENKIRKIYARLACIRENYLHQVTHALVEMLPAQVSMEDLNVKGMMKNKHISGAVAEQCFYDFINKMKYKCDWNHIAFVQVPRFYPSSKTCSACGYVNKELKLSDRTYICPVCGIVIDRDYNAAINIMRYTRLHPQAVA